MNVLVGKLIYWFKLNLSKLCAFMVGGKYGPFWSLYNFCSWREQVVKRSRDVVFLDFTVKNREIFYSWISGQMGDDIPIDYIELGVFQGESIRRWSQINKHPDSRFFGFDTFEGLPEKWMENPAGTFNVDGNIPEIDDPRVNFIKGRFQDSLPNFVSTFEPRNRLVMHLDADLYSSTLFSLIQFNKFIVDGTILIFDEFSEINHEFAAFREFAQICYRKWTLMGGNEGFHKVAIKIRE